MKNAFQKSMFCLLILYVSLCLSSCYSSDDLAYYSDKTNYMQAKGIVRHITYSDDMTELYLGLSDLNPEFEDSNFRIVGDSVAIVQSNGIDKKLQIGDEILFAAAPKYLGDGYAIPIVELVISGENLLAFEVGFANLQEWLADYSS